MGGVDVVGMFRAVAGSDESIGYAVLNKEGTGLEKAAAHRHLTGRNVTPAPSDDHASVRYMLYSALKEGVAGQQHAEQFLGMAREKLGITQENGVLTFSNTPLERRSIRVVLQAFDSIATGSGALTKEESALAGLFSMANFANEKTPAPELYKFASSVHDVMTGKTALERAEVGGVSVVVCKAGDGKVGVFFGSGYREIKMNPDFFRGVQKNAFAHFDEFTPASVGRILASFADKVNIPLSADAQHVRELCRSMVLAKFPAGVDVVRLDNLSPSSMLHLAGEIARGAITKPETLMQAVGQFDGQLNSITGENRAPGGRNELGGTMDKNINAQENDYLVERFLKSSEEDQNNVQFSEECDRPVKLSKTMSNEEIDKFIGPYKKDLSVGGVVKDKVVGVIQGFASLFKSTYSEDDVAALTEMLGKPEAEPPQENGFFGAVGGFFKGFGLFGKPAEEPKKAEAKPAEEKKAEPPEDTLFELSVDDGKGGKETKFVTASNLKTVAKLMCEAGEDDKHLDELKGGLSTRAKAFANAFRADPRLRPLLDSCQSGNEAEFEKGVMSLCRPFDGEAGDKLRMALDAFDDQAEAWTKDDLAMFTLSNKSNAAVLAKLLSARASGLFDVEKLDPAIAPKAQKLLALFDGLKAEYADEAGKKHPLSDLYANRRALELEIRRLGSSGLNEHDVAEIRDAFADLLQDSNTWETDKLKDVPGARLSYSLNKNAEAMAAFLCNRHQVGIFGFPTSIFAKALLENLDAFPKNMMDEVFVPGNEQDAAQALRAMLTQSGVKAALAVAEQKIDEQAEVTCKELQIVTSSQFTAMLSGAGGDVDADKIRESFGWLRGLLARTPAGADANGNVSKQCDVAMDFLKGLTGRTAPEFEKVFK
ncbi:MAG: hypothetical protein MJ138_01460, partial [Kiritimatiellae bacterium]|nr:hypothetical protein [Kiritimatiellia bacterium]